MFGCIHLQDEVPTTIETWHSFARTHKRFAVCSIRRLGVTAAAGPKNSNQKILNTRYYTPAHISFCEHNSTDNRNSREKFSSRGKRKIQCSPLCLTTNVESFRGFWRWHGITQERRERERETVKCERSVAK